MAIIHQEKGGSRNKSVKIMESILALSFVTALEYKNKTFSYNVLYCIFGKFSYIASRFFRYLEVD